MHRLKTAPTSGLRTIEVLGPLQFVVPRSEAQTPHPRGLLSDQLALSDEMPHSLEPSIFGRLKMRIHFSIQSFAAGTEIGKGSASSARHARLAYLQTLATCRNRVVTKPFAQRPFSLDAQKQTPPHFSSTVSLVDDGRRAECG